MIRVALRIALRDLRGGTRGLIIVLLCLGVGVASIAGIGSLRAALGQGLAEDGRAILGGDFSLSTSLAPFPAGLSVWLNARGAQVSETVETRSILVAPSGHRLLVAAKVVSPGWPLIGKVTTQPSDQFARLENGPDGRPGLILDPTAAQTLKLHPGDEVTLGGVKLAYRGTITDSPDRIADSRLFGVKAFVSLPALAGSPLVTPGGLVNFNLQAAVPPGASVQATLAALKMQFPHNTWRIRTTGDAAPDLSRFVDQAALFMTLLGLSALLVGGIGVANGVEAWLAARARSIATLRCLGGSARMVSLIHGLQLAILGIPGILAGLMVGAILPALVLPALRDTLPIPHHVGLYLGSLALAGTFGLLVGIIFALGPLRRAAAIPGAALFRAAALPPRVPWRPLSALIHLLLVVLLMALAALSVPRPILALGFCVGAIATLGILRGVAAVLRWLLPHLPKSRNAAVSLALRRLHGPGSPLPLMLMSAGAGLTVLVAVAEIRANLMAEFAGELPQEAPSFYFIDIQPAELPTFEAVVRNTHVVHDLKELPSLRARILAVKGVPVAQFRPKGQNDWPLRTDVGFTYAAKPPTGTQLHTGQWWPDDYLGPPEVSFDARIADAWGIGVGDTLTVSVLGRQFDLKIANLRDIHWQSLGLNFLMIGTPDPFAGAPHTIIATLKADPGQAGTVLAAVTDALPGVTGIDVGQVLQSLKGLLGQIGTAISLVGLVALLAGGLVLVSAIAAERERRIAEAVVLKTLGATRSQIRLSWLTEFAIAGGIAGIAAAILGDLAAAVTIRQVFHTEWHFLPGIMLATILVSIFAMMALGFVSTERVLRQPAAPRLRLENGG
ncbi:ABC transporter permease [Acidisoma cellulosilytica]|uniref:ABC transporter permease n=1 Tax=Acidisoma cellulosilyticum TaxID=2802395 RepID=A0A964E5L6_9PROT|nr:FtsX-like permease family protein [Acidisoma cellulosilyticum]MCB8882661.1 ABC transporter permease [Acidisoma cellulosilyticum]